MHSLNIFTATGTTSTLIYLSLAGITGVLLGKIKVFNIKMGIAGVLFTALLLGHLGVTPSPEVLHFIKEFGLILFVYSIGLEVGPRFIPSLKNNGLKMNLLASGIVLSGVLIAAAIKISFNIPLPIITGVMCGAVTNTPSLGAAQQVITEQLAGQPGVVETTGMGYALAYPFGIIGIIFTMILLRLFFKISVKKEEDNYQKESSNISGNLEAVNLTVINQALIGKKLDFINDSLKGEFVMSRIWRDGNFFIPDENTQIEKNDVLYGVSNEDFFTKLELQVGPLKQTGEIEITGKLGMRHVVITKKEIAGKTIKQIGISRKYPVNITRIFRAGSEILPMDYDTIEFGDTVRLVGERKVLKTVAKGLGNSMKELSHPNIIPILIGIFAGVLLGSIPIAIPGLPAPVKLGLAGGPLLIAIYLGHKGRIGKCNFYMTPGANLFIRELGIILFLACVGLGAGKDFASTFVNGGYMWMIYGIIITFVPLIIFGTIARFMKFNYLSICGLLAGSMTDPPALEFANSISPSQAQSTAYATVYPLVMFLRVLVSQILVLLFL